jgi:hypothetical protein
MGHTEVGGGRVGGRDLRGGYFRFTYKPAQNFIMVYRKKFIWGMVDLGLIF